MAEVIRFCIHCGGLTIHSQTLDRDASPDETTEFPLEYQCLRCAKVSDYLNKSLTEGGGPQRQLFTPDDK